MKLKLKPAFLEICPTDHSPFKRFPLDVVTNVVLFLDFYALRALLEAYNHDIARHFILIRDEVMTPSSPTFFKNLNIRTIQWRKFVRKKTRKLDHFIPLIELTDWYTMQTGHTYDRMEKEHIKLYGPKSWGTSNWHSCVVNHTSFVFYCRAAGDYMYTRRQQTMNYLSATQLVVLRHVPIKRTLVRDNANLTDKRGRKHQDTNKMRNFSKEQTGCGGKLNIQGLTHISIEYLPLIELFYSIYIRNLTLLFGKSETLVIEGVDLPFLSHLTIVYSDYFPVFGLVDLGNRNGLIANISETSERSVYYPRTMLQFIHMDASIRVYRKSGSPLRPCLTTLEEMKTRDLSFSQRFSSIHVVGGHDAILDRLDFSNCRELRWRQVNKQPVGSTPITRLSIPHLNAFSYETCHPYVSVPVLETLQETAIQRIIVVTTAVGLDLNGLLENPQANLDKLVISAHQDPSGMVNHITGKEQGRIVLSPSEILERNQNIEVFSLNEYISIDRDKDEAGWRKRSREVECCWIWIK